MMPSPSQPWPPQQPQAATAADTRPTRRPMALWDRMKWLLLLFGLFWFFVWSDLSGNPLKSFGDAYVDTFESKWWILALMGVETLRQLHYLLSERNAGYYAFWQEKVFGSMERRTSKLNAWNRYRMARAAKIILWIVVIDLVLASLFDVSPAQALFEIPARIYVALPFVFQLAFGFFFVMFQFIGLFWFLSRGGVDTYFPEDIETRFSDVWGQDAVVERVKENMVFLEEPEKVEEKGGYVPGGILLWGPPGTGKTLMAEAVAGETGKPFVFVDPGAFINMFMGVGILKVKGLFRKLRKLALRYGGVIVFFDEADSLGNRGAAVGGGGQIMSPNPFVHDHLRWLSPAARADVWRTYVGDAADDAAPGARRDGIMMGGMMGGGGGGTLQALLSELSGLKKPRGFINRYVRRALGMRPKPPPKYRILVMMATNMPESLDPAMLRPGRIDRIYKVGYPSKEGRKRTYEGYLDKVAHTLTEGDVEKLAVQTPYATGATIKDLVNEALITAIRDDRDVIEWSDVIRAKHLKDLGPPEDVEYIERERHAVAVHEACHAVTAYHLRHHLTIDLATIEKGGTYLGMVSSIPPEDLFTRWRSEYEADIQVSLASLAGERLFFDADSSSGVAGDLESATTLATLMEGYWGMGQTVSSHAALRRRGIGGGGPPGGGEEEERLEAVERALGERIEANLARLLEEVEELLRTHRTDVLAVAHALETHKTLAGEDIAAVIEGHPGPIIDGRPYRSGRFAELAEQYHEVAARAHREHSGVNIPLPVLTPHMATGTTAASVAFNEQPGEF
jgi:ATP-dependent Zn protease